jgi:putative sigma-54 modulation protein
MNVKIRCADFELTEAIRAHAERRLAFAVSRWSDQLSDIQVRLEDINGPRGGDDKICRIQMRLKGHGEHVVEAHDSDLYQAIGIASERAGRKLERALSRHALGGN